LGYLQAGKVVVRQLDGKIVSARAGDPVRADFDVSEALPSPDGALVARREAARVVVERSDGSARRVLPTVTVGHTTVPYEVAAWSPDSQELLLMFDVSGRHFTMVSVSVTAPFNAVSVVEMVGVNNARSWPGRFDVSWQPTPT